MFTPPLQNKTKPTHTNHIELTQTDQKNNQKTNDHQKVTQKKVKSTCAKYALRATRATHMMMMKLTMMVVMVMMTKTVLLVIFMMMVIMLVMMMIMVTDHN